MTKPQIAGPLAATLDVVAEGTVRNARERIRGAEPGDARTLGEHVVDHFDGLGAVG